MDVGSFFAVLGAATAVVGLVCAVASAVAAVGSWRVAEQAELRAASSAEDAKRSREQAEEALARERAAHDILMARAQREELQAQVEERARVLVAMADRHAATQGATISLTFSPQDRIETLACELLVNRGRANPVGEDKFEVLSRHNLPPGSNLDAFGKVSAFGSW